MIECSNDCEYDFSYPLMKNLSDCYFDCIETQGIIET